MVHGLSPLLSFSFFIIIIPGRRIKGLLPEETVKLKSHGKALSGV